jgi:TPR repeat protein
MIAVGALNSGACFRLVGQDVLSAPRTNKLDSHAQYLITQCRELQSATSRFAEQNLALAQYNLGVCYDRADGVAEDWVEAYKWLLLAARQGHGAPKKHMTLLESKLLTPEQIAQGQKRAREFKPR